MFQVTSLNSMSGILEDALREYNETYATMDLVLFEDAMKHVSSGLRCHHVPKFLLCFIGSVGHEALFRLMLAVTFRAGEVG